MINKQTHIALILFLTVGYCYGAGTSDIGTDTGVFLKMGAGARAAGMADTYSAVCNDASAVYWNPAALNRAGSFGLMFTHAIWFSNVSYEWGGINLDTEIGKFGVGVQYVSYGSITQTDGNGLDYGSLSPSDLSTSISYANNLEGLDYGITAKYISMTLQQSATGITFDVGIEKMFDIVSGIRMSIALVGNNIFGQTANFGNLSESLTSSYKLGIALNLNNGLLISTEACMPSDDATYYSAGGEYSIGLTSDLKAELRCGYSTLNSQTGGLNGFTFGMGIGSREYSIDYAFVPYGNLGYTHRFSLTVAFGKDKTAQK